jgi:hypothetical protein
MRPITKNYVKTRIAGQRDLPYDTDQGLKQGSSAVSDEAERAPQGHIPVGRFSRITGCVVRSSFAATHLRKGT